MDYRRAGLSGSVIQILLFPCGRLLAYVLPDWGVSLWGVRHSLNPGPWSFKEQMFATITFNIAIVGCLCSGPFLRPPRFSFPTPGLGSDTAFSTPPTATA